MNRRVQFIVLGFLILTHIPLSAQEQETANWRVVVAGTEWLYSITADGISETLEPEILYPPLQLSDYETTVMNGDFFAVRAEDTIILGDSRDPERCCTSIPDPALTYSEAASQRGEIVSDTSLLAITADGRFLIMGIVEERERTFNGSVLLFPATAQSEGVVIYSTQRDNASVNSGVWVGNQFHMFLDCYLCTHGSLVSEHLIYEYDGENGGQLTAVTLYFEAGAFLYATGELLQLTQNTDYPLNETEGPLPMPNVLVYRPEPEAESVVLYHDAENLGRFPPNWVLDGQAYLMETNDLWLVYRDGRVETVEYPNPISTTFLSGTPDGWLVMEYDSGRVLHYTSATEFVEVGTLSAETFPKIISATALGLDTVLTPPQPFIP